MSVSQRALSEVGNLKLETGTGRFQSPVSSLQHRWDGLSVCRVARSLRRWHARRGQDGQAAVIFIVIMALIIFLASMTMNLGEVARLKTATANAADSGALAGASWVASGENELAMIARGMEINAWLVQLMFIVPFCWELFYIPLMIMAALIVYNKVFLEPTAQKVIHAAWDSAKAAALFTAVANASIDDTSGDVQEELDRLQKEYRDNQDFPSIRISGSPDNRPHYRKTFTWMRTGADRVERRSRVTVDVEFRGQAPEFKNGGWGPTFWFWSPCFQGGGANCCICYWNIGWYCWSAWGWTSDNAKNGPNKAQNPKPSTSTGANEGGRLAPTYGDMAKVVGTKIWSNVVSTIAGPVLFVFVYWPPKTCTSTTCIPIFGSAGGSVCPGNISHSNGEVVVRITQQRSGGGRLGFWRMRYPNQIVSESHSSYGGASLEGCFGWSQPDARARLESVR